MWDLRQSELKGGVEERHIGHFRGPKKCLREDSAVAQEFVS
jgi:hypothetical protein